MATPKKTKSGKWHLTLFLGLDADGKQVYKSITGKTKAECTKKAEEAKRRGIDADRRPKIVDLPRVIDAVDKYIDLCATLSPTTISGYEKIKRTAFPHLMQTPIQDLTEDLVQDAINKEAYREGRRGRISAHTVHNEWGLIASALWHHSRLRFDVRLPKSQPKLKYYPEPQEVMDLVVGTDIELPCLLALWLSFSMSEIRGLKFSDVRGDTITINRVLVDVGTTPTIKENAKTAARIRRHRLPPYLRDLIEQADHSTEFIVPRSHGQIYDRFRQIMNGAGIDITFHDLRHLNASVMLALNVPEKYAMERGGWSTPHTMREVYQHTFSRERVQIDNKIDGYFAAMLHQTYNNSYNKNSLTIEKSMEVRGSNPLRSTNFEDDGNDETR